MSVLRDARERGDDRNRQTGRGSQVNYYEDLGFSTTETGYEKANEYKASQAEAIAAEKKRLSSLQGEVNTAKSGLSTYKSQLDTYKGSIAASKAKLATAQAATDPSKLPALVNTAYESAKKNGTLIPARVVNGNNVEATYWITKETANEIKNSGLSSNWVDDNKFFNVEVNQSGRIMGQEIHDQLRGVQASTQTSFKQQAQREIAGMIADSAGAISSAQSQIAEAQKSYDNSYSQYINQQGTVERAQASVGLQQEQLQKFGEMEQKFLTDIADTYDGKIDRMSAMMEKLKIDTAEGGEGEAAPTLTEQIVQGENIPVAEVPNTEAIIAEEKA